MPERMMVGFNYTSTSVLPTYPALCCLFYMPTDRASASTRGFAPIASERVCREADHTIDHAPARQKLQIIVVRAWDQLELLRVVGRSYRRRLCAGGTIWSWRPGPLPLRPATRRST